MRKLVEAASMLTLTQVREELNSPQHPLAQFFWQHTREGWAFVAPDGRMEIVNPAFAEMLGWSVPELTGLHFQDITIQGDVEPDEKMLGRLLKGDILSYTMVKTYRTKAGNTVTCKLKALNFDTGKLVIGTILPIDTLSLEHLPPDEEKRVIAMLVGRWAMEYWRRILAVLGGMIGLARIDHILDFFQSAVQ